MAVANVFICLVGARIGMKSSLLNESTYGVATTVPRKIRAQASLRE